MTKYICQWRSQQGDLCLHSLQRAQELKAHFQDVHIMQMKVETVSLACRWRGCSKMSSRHCLLVSHMLTHLNQESTRDVKALSQQALPSSKMRGTRALSTPDLKEISTAPAPFPQSKQWPHGVSIRTLSRKNPSSGRKEGSMSYRQSQSKQDTLLDDVLDSYSY
jgi:hypothetical protein